MKLLRVGDFGKEKVAVLVNGKIKDLSDHLEDLSPTSLNNETLKRLNKIEFSNLKDLDPSERIGSCISNPIDFLAIGLNYKAHAEGSNSKLPTEPILFNKSSGCIQGPNDKIVKPKFASTMDYECEVGMIIGKEGKYIEESQAQNYIFG